MELTEVAIFTADVASTTGFYERLFGKPEYADESMATFDVNGVDVLIHETDEGNEANEVADEHASLPTRDHVAFAVEDVDETYETLTDAGLTVFREPTTYEWGRSAYFTDPDGRIVEIIAE